MQKRCLIKFFMCNLCEIVSADSCDADALIRSVAGVQDVAVAAGRNTIKGQMPVAFVVRDAVDTTSLSSRCCEAVRMLVGAFAEPTIIAVPEVPKTVTGKAARSLLRAALCAEPTLSAEAVDRSVSNPHAYWSCLNALNLWRGEKEARADISLLKRDDWDVFNFECHGISGSAIVPATGWVLLMLRVVRTTVLENVRFLRAARNKHQEFVAQVQVESSIDVVAAASGAAIDSSGRDVYVQALIPNKDELPLKPGSYWDLAQWDDEDVLEDIDGTIHYRRCRAVGLSYVGPYACVGRVAWRGESTFRAHVHVKHANGAALLDAALQVVCSVDAVGGGSAFIPFAIEKAEVAAQCISSGEALVVGRLRARTASTIKVDLWYFDFVNSDNAIFGVLKSERCFAMLVGVSLSRLEQPSSGSDHAMLQPAFKASETSIQTVHGNSVKRIASQTSKCKDALERLPLHTIDTVLELSAEVVGNMVDPGKSLFENGIHSLRRIELISKLSIAYDISFDARTISSIESFDGIATTVDGLLDGRVDTKSRSSNMPDRFGHVNVASLQRIVEARLLGTEVSIGAQTCVTSPSVVHEAIRAVLYMVRRGFMRYIGIQYCDGLAHFLCRPPRLVHLDIEVIVPGPYVGFQQTDYNRHFTVREIIRDSERGFYNLVHASGLAHLEHYYRVMFFASRVEGRFDLELLEGEPYDMHAKIASITGPLVDIDVAFYKANRKNNLDTASRAFVVKWRLMLVLNADTKQIFDFEHGRVLTHVAAETILDINGKLVDSTGSLWRRTRERTGLGRDSVVLVLLVVALVCPFFLASTIRNSVISAVTKSSLTPIEVLVVLSSLSLWFRVSVRMDTCDGPIDALLPHG